MQMSGFVELVAALAVLSPAPPLDNSDKRAAIILGEDKPRQIVSSFFQKGEFPEPRLRYQVSYSLREGTHSFVLTANGRQVTIEVPKRTLPDLDASDISVGPRSYNDPTLSVHVGSGPRLECFKNLSVRESLIFSFEEVVTITKLSYVDCELQLIDLKNSGIRVGRIGLSR